jgi:hypothetical protein
MYVYIYIVWSLSGGAGLGAQAPRPPACTPKSLLQHRLPRATGHGIQLPSSTSASPFPRGSSSSSSSSPFGLHQGICVSHQGIDRRREELPLVFGGDRPLVSLSACLLVSRVGGVKIRTSSGLLTFAYSVTSAKGETTSHKRKACDQHDSNVLADLPRKPVGLVLFVLCAVGRGKGRRGLGCATYAARICSLALQVLTSA